MRKIIKDPQGTLRFKENKIVRTLLEESRKRGFTLNDLACFEFTQEDWEDFYQAIGYSVRGYHELSNVSDKSALAASRKAKKVLPKFFACRDIKCPIHYGVSVKKKKR